MVTLFYMGKGWSLGITGEYDIFWHGWHQSEVGEAGLGMVPLKFDQNDGWGARSSVKIIKNIGKIDIAIEPYFRYWDIDDSDLDINVCDFWGFPLVDDGYIEPANTTMEWGTRVGIRF